ncbi:hypothetical protein C0J45_19609 [Silurus meridionalis]|nr:hypothetical protein C0J45_19609 [Silurus meridionalis]
MNRCHLLPSHTNRAGSHGPERASSSLPRLYRALPVCVKVGQIKLCAGSKDRSCGNKAVCSRLISECVCIASGPRTGVAVLSAGIRTGEAAQSSFHHHMCGQRDKSNTTTGQRNIRQTQSGTLNTEAHLHISLADKEGRTVGGHVLGDLEVFTTAEVILGEATDLHFTRQMDSRTGFPELVIEKRLEQT